MASRKPSPEGRMAAMKRRAKRKGDRGMETIPAQGGNPPIHFQRGALHRQLGVPLGEKIPAAKMAAAKAGRYGPQAKRRALFARNVLTGRGR